METRTISFAFTFTIVAVGSALATDRAARSEASHIFREGHRLIRQEPYSAALARFERSLTCRSLRNAGLQYRDHPSLLRPPRPGRAPLRDVDQQSLPGSR
jgi:hypothetical protein